jgi:hypothetical protein
MAAAVTEFAGGHDMTIVPAIPGRDSGRTVSLNPDVVDLHGFLELARKLGDGALYLRTETFGLDPETGKPEEVPASLAHREGQVCELSIAFASAGHGLLHFWEQAEPWYQEFLDSQDAEMLHDADEEWRVRGKSGTVWAAEVAETILADREFCASSLASGAGARRCSSRKARTVTSAGTRPSGRGSGRRSGRTRLTALSRVSSMTSQLSSLPVPAGSRPPRPERGRRPPSSS